MQLIIDDAMLRFLEASGAELRIRHVAGPNALSDGVYELHLRRDGLDGRTIYHKHLITEDELRQFRFPPFISQLFGDSPCTAPSPPSSPAA